MAALGKVLGSWGLAQETIDRAVAAAETLDDLAEATREELETWVFASEAALADQDLLRRQLVDEERGESTEGRGLQGELEAMHFGGTTVLKRAVEASGNSVAEIVKAESSVLEEYVIAPPGQRRLAPLQEARFRRWIEARSGGSSVVSRWLDDEEAAKASASSTSDDAGDEDSTDESAPMVPLWPAEFVFDRLGAQGRLGAPILSGSKGGSRRGIETC